MGQAASNVINLNDIRRKKIVKGEILALHSPQDASPSALLSFNLANVLFSTATDISRQKSREKDPDLQAALLFARARLNYLEGRFNDAAKIFHGVLNMANSEDLRALALLAWCNCQFSQGDYQRAKNTLAANELEIAALPDALRLAVSVLKGNIAFAMGSSAIEAAAHYRKVFSEQTRSLWVQRLQQTLVGFNPVTYSEFRTENLKGLRNLLDAFIEVGSSRYFASLVLTFS